MLGSGFYQCYVPCDEVCVWNEAIWNLLSSLSYSLVLDLEDTGLHIHVNAWLCSLVNR